MTSRYSIRIEQEKENLFQRLSETPHNLFQIVVQIHCVTSLDSPTISETFNRSVVCRRDEFLSEEQRGPNIIHSIVTTDWGGTQEFADVIVPHVMPFARDLHNATRNLGRKVIKFRVELVVEDDPIDELSLISTPINFNPASKSSIEALKRTNWVKDSSSTEVCVVCLDEFVYDDKVVYTPCNHVYHDSCIVQWFETSNMCPMCRYPMPTR